MLTPPQKLLLKDQLDPKKKVSRAPVNYKNAVHLCPSLTRFCKILTALSTRLVSKNKGRNARSGKCTRDGPIPDPGQR